MPAGDLAFTTGIYTNFKNQVLQGAFNLATDAGIKIMLTATYTAAATHSTRTDVLAAGTELTGTGYTARGKALTGKAVTTSGTAGMFDAADLTWTALNAGTPSHAILYKDTTTDGTSLLIMAWILGTASNGGDYTLTFGANGLLRIT